MIITLSGRDRVACKEIFDQLFRLRHQVFVEGRHWSLPCKGQFEVDQYDKDDAQYFYGLDGDGNLISHVRLTPSMTSSLIADCFSHLADDPTSIRSPAIYEGTRYIVQPRTRSREAMSAAKAELLIGMFTWAHERGCSDVQVIIETQLLPTFFEMTPEVRPMGLSGPYGGGSTAPGGGDAIAIRCPASLKVIDDLRAFGGLVNGIELRQAAAAA
jgi:acyl-homoserine lactone synthase